MKVYTFWFGDENKKTILVQKFEELNQIVGSNHKFILGPSKEEHEYLLNNFEYYKKACEDKKYAYMADVYRFWKLSENFGIYMDALIGINKSKIKIFLDELEISQKSFILKEDKYYAHSCLFFINSDKAQRICIQTINRYSKYKNIKNCDYIEASPLQLTQSLKELNLFIKGYEFASNEVFNFYPLIFIDNNNLDNIFYSSSQGSWKKNNKNINNQWKKAFSNYYKHKHKSFLVGLYGYLYWNNPRFLKVLLFFYGRKALYRFKSLGQK